MNKNKGEIFVHVKYRGRLRWEQKHDGVKVHKEPVIPRHHSANHEVNLSEMLHDLKKKKEMLT